MWTLKRGSFGCCLSKYADEVLFREMLMNNRYGRVIDDNREDIGYPGP
jgi:hypothetical protein